MKAAVLVWAYRREVWEQELLLGPDRTLLPHTINNLVSAWYCWRACKMGLSGHPAGWDPAPSCYDASLCHFHP